MTVFRTALAGLLLAVGMLVAAAAPQASAVDGTVTRAEFRNVNRGDTLARVKNAWNVGHGRCWYYNGEWGLAWRIKGKETWVTAEFRFRNGKWRLMSKEWNSLYINWGGCRRQPF